MQGLSPAVTANPLNYPVNRLRVGNGQGFSTLQPALGFPAGGLGPDNRIGLYLGDSWKVKPNLTLSLGLRYDRDTGRTDSDLPAIPEINAVFPGWGNQVKQAEHESGAAIRICLGSQQERQNRCSRRSRAILRKRDLEQRSLRSTCATPYRSL